jgi:hypothetical protein
LASDACSRPPIIIKFHDLHAYDIKGVVGEIVFYHERLEKNVFPQNPNVPKETLTFSKKLFCSRRNPNLLPLLPPPGPGELRTENPKKTQECVCFASYK